MRPASLGAAASSYNNNNNNNNNNGLLSSMFSPNASLTFHGSFQSARAAAKDGKKWLLVNIQSENEFACHALNRDVWQDGIVESIVRER